MAADSEKNWKALLPFWVLAALIFRERVDVRPEIFGFFFFSLFLYLFQKQAWLFILHFIELLWVNIHLSFVFGLFLTLLWLLQRKKIKISLSIFLATLFNPHFIRGAIYPFLIFTNYGYSIVENQTIFFLEKMIANPNILFFKIGIFLGVVSFLLTPKPSAFSIFCFLALAAVASWQIRHFPFFALFLTFIFSQNFSLVFESKVLKKTQPILAGIGVFLSLVISFFYLSNFYYKTHDRNFRFGLSPKKISAEKGTNFLLNYALTVKIFNNFDIGSYLDFKLYPKVKVFADSRPEAYPEKFWQEYKRAQDEEKAWENLVKKYKIEAIFFAHTDSTPWAESFLKRIVNDSSWKIVYLDETIVVFFRKTLPTPKIILREDVLDVAKRDSDPSRLIYLANFYRKAGWFEEEKILLEKALRINSWSFWANARLAQIYLASGNPILEYKAWALKEKLKNPIFWF